MEILDKILPYASITMLGILAAFVLFGMLTGMARGFKRSALRLVIFVGLLLAVFFLTPVIINAILAIDVQIVGRTPNEWVQYASDELVVVLQDQFGSYIAPFSAYISEFALAMVLAVVNLILFIVLYMVLKFVSWILYSILAAFIAPKCDRHGNKYPKHAMGGLLVGIVQGIALFVFFMFPINGVLGVMHQAVQYQATEGVESVEPQLTVASEDGEEIDLGAVMSKIDGSLTLYHQVMNYSGLQFLSDKAFEYQLTVRIDDTTKINLLKDINTAWELYVDAQSAKVVFDKIADVFETRNFAQLNAKDYQVLRRMVNKVFDLEILNLADWILADLDEIFNTPFGENEELLAGTDIYVDSIYGNLAEQCVTERVVVAGANNNLEFTKGLRAIVNRIADQKLDLIRNDVLCLLDLAEMLSTYQINYNGTVNTVAGVCSQDNLDWRNYLEVITARLAVAQNNYSVDTPIISAVGDKLKQFSLVQMLGLADMDNLIVYSNLLDDNISIGEETKTLIYDLAKLFLGEQAFTQNDVEGNWEKLGNLLLDWADVVRDNQNLVDEIAKMIDDDNLAMQAIMDIVENLMMTEDYYLAHVEEFGGKSYDEVKFQNLDNILDVLYETLHKFAPLESFITDRLTAMNSEEENELLTMVVDLVTAERSEWSDTFHGLVSAANLMNNQVISDLMESLENGDEALGTDDIAKILDAVENELDAETVCSIVDTVINLPEVGETVKDNLNDVLNQIDNNVVSDIFGDAEGNVDTEVNNSMDTLKNYFNDEYAGEPISDEQFKSAVETLLGAVQNSDYIKDLLENQGAGAE